MHDDQELEALLHASVVERTELHAWPLSAVERLVLSDGRRLIYKAQLPPTLEAEVYASAKSDLLPHGEVLEKRRSRADPPCDFAELGGSVGRSLAPVGGFVSRYVG